MILVTAYLFFMYDAPVLSGMLVFFLIYPVASAVYLAAAGRKVVPVPDRIPPLGEKNKEIKAGISLRNISARMSLRYECMMEVRDGNGRKCAKERSRGMLLSKAEDTVWFRFETERCGIMEIGIDSVKIYDFMGIFYRKVKWKKKARIKIMPDFLTAAAGRRSVGNLSGQGIQGERLSERHSLETERERRGTDGKREGISPWMCSSDIH